MTEPAPTVIRIVDDDDSMRTALGRLLTAAGYEVRLYASAGDFLLVEPDGAAGCLLLDVQMPGPSGLDLQQSLLRRGSALPIVFLSAHGDVPSTVRAIKSGASDFLCKPVERQTLLSAIEVALSVDATVPVGTTTGQGDPAALSERERVVLRGIVDGRLNKQICADLGLSERTIKTCRAEVMRKLGARSLAALVQMAPKVLPPR